MHKLGHRSVNRVERYLQSIGREALLAELTQFWDYLVVSELRFKDGVIVLGAGRNFGIKSAGRRAFDWLGIDANKGSGTDIEEEGSVVTSSVANWHGADVGDLDVWSGPDGVDGFGAAEVCSSKGRACRGEGGFVQI